MPSVLHVSSYLSLHLDLSGKLRKFKLTWPRPSDRGHIMPCKIFCGFNFILLAINSFAPAGFWPKIDFLNKKS
jgi:hypothetical protein